MHLSRETQAAYAEGLLGPDEAKAAHRHLATCVVCASGVADQLAIIHALGQLPQPVPASDGWPAIAAALSEGWQAAPAPGGHGRFLLPPRRQPWAAAAVVTLGLAVVLALSIAQPAPADDEIDQLWQEHLRFSAGNSVSAQHVAQYRSLTWTHRLLREPSP